MTRRIAHQNRRCASRLHRSRCGFTRPDKVEQFRPLPALLEVEVVEVDYISLRRLVRSSRDVFATKVPMNALSIFGIRREDASFFAVKEEAGAIYHAPFETESAVGNETDRGGALNARAQPWSMHGTGRPSRVDTTTSLTNSLGHVDD